MTSCSFASCCSVTCCLLFKTLSSIDGSGWGLLNALDRRRLDKAPAATSAA
jgi:hypothetical protein